MTKIAYFYTGNKAYIDEIIKNNITILIESEEYYKELKDYNLNIKNVKYDKDYYDILISDKDDIKNIGANKKVVIGKGNRPRILYLDKFDTKQIFKEKEENHIKFTIVVPNYNNGDWINKTIESVLNQTYDNWEMYIIDDMSTDNSIEVIKKYKDKRIELIQNEIKLYNGGSRNIGILKAKKSNPGGYLLFIDSDDWLSNDNVLKNLNNFIIDEDLITLNYMYYLSESKQTEAIHRYKNKDELFMTIGAMCAVWCKCFKVSIAPLFEFNTLMEDRVYHYRLVNKCNKIADFGQITHIWNKTNTKSITTNKDQKYDSELQLKIEWNNCAYRHIAAMLDLLNELDNEKYKDFINDKIKVCKHNCNSGIYLQF